MVHKFIRKKQSKKLYIVRHGQTDYNKKGILQGGKINAHLNATGQAQGKAFYDKYKDVSFDKVYASALIRTQESVQGFIDKGIPFETFKELNEMSWGKYDGMKITEDSKSIYWTSLKKWDEGESDYCIDDAESPVAVQKRIVKALEIILDKDDEQTVLICIHGRALRILLCTFFGRSLTDMDFFKHNNLGLYVLNYDGSSFEIEKSNDFTHLHGITND